MVQGSGGSAVWLADMLRHYKSDMKVFSYDINKPTVEHELIEFIELDLTESREWALGTRQKVSN